jgi:hypothetical protein
VGAKKGYAVDAQADSAEATTKKKPSRFRCGKITKKSTKAVAKVEEMATWSVAKASSSSDTKTSDSEDSSSTDSEESADDDEVEVCEVGCASEEDVQEVYWEEQQCFLDDVLSSDDSSLEEAYEADVECSGAATDDEDQESKGCYYKHYDKLMGEWDSRFMAFTGEWDRRFMADPHCPLEQTHDLPSLPATSASRGHRLTRAAPASMPYMTLQRGGVLEPCSRGDGDRACDVCAEAGEGNSARIAALKHASL